MPQPSMSGEPKPLSIHGSPREQVPLHTRTACLSLRTGLSAGPGPPWACFREAASAQPADSGQRDPASVSARTLSPTRKSDQISAVGPATALPGDNGPSQCALNRMTQQFSSSNAVCPLSSTVTPINKDINGANLETWAILRTKGLLCVGLLRIVLCQWLHCEPETDSRVEKVLALLVGGAHRGGLPELSSPLVSDRRAHGVAEGRGLGRWHAAVQRLARSRHRVGLWRGGGDPRRAREPDHASSRRLPKGLLAEIQVWTLTAIFRATIHGGFAALSLLPT